MNNKKVVGPMWNTIKGYQPLWDPRKKIVAPRGGTGRIIKK